MSKVSVRTAINIIRANRHDRVTIKGNITLSEAHQISQALSPSSVIKNFGLSNCQITDDALLVILQGLRQCISGKVLNLSWNSIGDTAAEALAHELVEAHFTWSRIHLIGNQIGRAGARALAETFAQSRIKCLDLGHNPLGFSLDQELIRVFAQGLANSSLTELYLSNSGVGDAELRELARGVEASPYLQVLSLSDNIVTDIGALALYDAIKTHRSMREIFLTGTKITIRRKVQIRNRLYVLRCSRSAMLTVLCSVYSRVGKKTSLRLLPREIMRMLDRALYRN